MSSIKYVVVMLVHIFDMTEWWAILGTPAGKEGFKDSIYEASK